MGRRTTQKSTGNGPPLVFISHDSRDLALAEAFSGLLATVSARTIRCFRSTDNSGGEGIPYGREWHASLMDNLERASDVVCLLTRRSVTKPWVMYEVGAARGMLRAPVHGLALGAKRIRDGPFSHLQFCDGSESALSKLVRQLCERVPGLTPDESQLKAAVKQFKQTVQQVLKESNSGGQTRWARSIPLRAGLRDHQLERVNELLEEVRAESEGFLAERGRRVSRDDLRANVLLPDFEFFDRSHFPGQLYFLSARPEGGYSKQELSNRFAPGEGVSGKVFLDGVAFAEDGKSGVSARKLRLMHQRLAGVAGFPLNDPEVRYAFGVACIDILGPAEVEPQDLTDLLAYGPVLERIREIAALLNPADNESFVLEFSGNV